MANRFERQRIRKQKSAKEIHIHERKLEIKELD